MIDIQYVNSQVHKIMPNYEVITHNNKIISNFEIQYKNYEKRFFYLNVKKNDGKYFIYIKVDKDGNLKEIYPFLENNVFIDLNDENEKYCDIKVNEQFSVPYGSYDIEKKKITDIYYCTESYKVKNGLRYERITRINKDTQRINKIYYKVDKSRFDKMYRLDVDNNNINFIKKLDPDFVCFYSDEDKITSFLCSWFYFNDRYDTICYEHIRY